jgi:hypothetical protein
LVGRELQQYLAWEVSNSITSSQTLSHVSMDIVSIILETVSETWLLIVYGKAKGKAIPVTGHGGPLGCETLRVPHYLDDRLTDGCKVVSLTRQLPFTPQEDSWYSFL